MKTYEVLEGALKEIQKGWCRGQAEDAFGNVCMAGAIKRTVHPGVGVLCSFLVIKTKEQIDLEVAAFQAIEGIPDVGRGRVPFFNDSHTQSEVEDKMREAIRKAKAGEGVIIEVEEAVAV